MTEAPLRPPAAWWPYLVPLLFLPCGAVYWAYGGDPAHGRIMDGGRAGNAVLALAALAGAIAFWRRGSSSWLPAAGCDLPARLLAVHPAAWCLLALVWQIVLWAVMTGLEHAPPREPGALRLADRAAALAAAAGLAAWWAGRVGARQMLTIAGTGVVALGIGALGVAAHWWGSWGVIRGALAVGPNPPFGLGNFLIEGALPLIGIAIGLAAALAAARRTDSAAALTPDASRGRAILLAGLGLGFAVLVAIPGILVPGASKLVASVVPITAALVLGAIVLRLPRSWQTPIVVAIAGAGLIALVLAWNGVLADLLAKPSWQQRMYLARAAIESWSPINLALGHGPGSAIAVLPEQPSFAAAWLTVPSFPEHCHNEVLELLIEGGLPLVALLGLALAATLAPLWQRRDEPGAQGLLLAWGGVVVAAMLSVHLTQTGPILLLALLAGASWAYASPPPADAAGGMASRRTGRRVVLAVLGLLGMAGSAIQAVRDFGDGGGVSAIHLRWLSAGSDATKDIGYKAYCLEVLRSRVGPLDTLDGRRAQAVGMLGRHDLAMELALIQARRLPCDLDNLDHLGSLSLLMNRLKKTGQAQRCILAVAAAESRLRDLVAAIPDNAHNHRDRTAITTWLRLRRDQAMARLRLQFASPTFGWHPPLKLPQPPKSALNRNPRRAQASATATPQPR